MSLLSITVYLQTLGLYKHQMETGPGPKQFYTIDIIQLS